MSLMSALNTGTSGLEANSLELSVIGDNLANSSTVGFKASRANFEDSLAETVIGAGPSQVGLGTNLLSVQRMDTQGSLLTTNRATDLALQGDGFFMVNGSTNGNTGTYYTRAGQFTVDNTGFLVNQQGLRVQGYTADSTGTIQPALGDLQVNSGTSPAQPTANITLRGNLQADAAILPAFAAATPGTTSNYSTSTTVYDTLGAAHQVDVYYHKSAAGAWDWHAVTDGGGLTGGTAGTPTEIATGTMTFGTSGQLTAMTTTTNNFIPNGAVNPQALTFNFGTPAVAGGATGLDGFTQFSSANANTFIGQDGFANGTLSSMTVDSKGELVGSFSNGQTRTLGQVAVANFPDQDKLQRLGGNLMMNVPDAGQPTVGAPGSSGHPSVSAGTLEQSNVDMAAEFVNMIAAQRGFQANGKTITTADSLLSELMNIKR